MSSGRAALATAGLIGLVATLDWLSRAEIAASLGYLLPISLAAWAAGRLGATLAGIACAGSWLAVALLESGRTTSELEVVNLIVLTVIYQLFGLLLATLREQLDHERKLARTDPLTSLHNRRALWGAIGREIARGRRHGAEFSLAYLDVDGFKKVNDTLGHHAGDALLRRIALALQEDLRELDLCARTGGDEFVILLPGTGEAGAGRAIQRLRRRLSRATWRKAFDIDFSIGVLTVYDAPSSVEEVVARADRLMYQVKRSGRGMVLYDALRLSVQPMRDRTGAEPVADIEVRSGPGPSARAN